MTDSSPIPAIYYKYENDFTPISQEKLLLLWEKSSETIKKIFNSIHNWQKYPVWDLSDRKTSVTLDKGSLYGEIPYVDPSFPTPNICLLEKNGALSGIVVKVFSGTKAFWTGFMEWREFSIPLIPVSSPDFPWSLIPITERSYVGCFKRLLDTNSFTYIPEVIASLKKIICCEELPLFECNPSLTQKNTKYLSPSV